MNTAIDSLQFSLLSQHILVPKEWLTACVEWLCQENQDLLKKHPVLCREVHEQWLLTDLRELELASLPEEVTAEKYVLNGTYCLQVNSITDVSTPLYGQLLEVQNRKNANDRVSAETQVTQKPWEKKPTRMLMMELTDGVLAVSGMEYRPIPCLHDRLPPGTKIRIKGVVTCRNGVLMLSASNVHVLGGEVEDLLNVNSKEAILGRKFNQPVVMRNEENQPSTSATSESNAEVLHPDLPSDMIDEFMDDGFDMDHGHQAASKPTTSATTPSQQATNADSQFEMDDDEQCMLMEMERIEAEALPLPSGKSTTAPKKTTLHSARLPNEKKFKPNFDGNLVSTKTKPITSRPLAKPVETKATPGPSRQTSIENAFKQSFKPLSEQYRPLAESAAAPAKVAKYDRSAAESRANEVKSDHLDEFDDATAECSAPDAKPPKTEAADLRYLCQVKKQCVGETEVRRVSVKAFIVTLLSKLQYKQGWSLKAKICDGTEVLDVLFSNDVLTQLIGFQAQEAQRIETDPACSLSKRLKDGTANCRKQIVSMCKIMDIELGGGDVTARVVALRDADQNFWSDMQVT